MGDFHKDRYKPLAEKLHTRVVSENGCLIWQSVVYRSKTGDVHPRIKSNKKSLSARRVAWELENGPIPDNHEIYVTCDRPLCIRHLAIRKKGTRPVHPNSIAAVKAHCGNRALPVAKKVPIYFYPENLSNLEVSRLSGVGSCNVTRLRSNRESIAWKRTRALRSVILREGVDSVVRFLCGKFPSCPRCEKEMRRYDSKNGRVYCYHCGKSKKAKPSEIVKSKIIRLTREKARLFIEEIANGKPSRQAGKISGVASTTVPKIRQLLFEEFGPPKSTGV